MTKSEVLRRTWADISLDAIDYNFRKIRDAANGAMVMAIVKADAYGHGDRMTAPFLEECGADWFGVSNLGEALGIRESGVTKPILILGGTPAECAGDLAEWNITQTAYSLQYAKELSAEAEKRGVTVDVHLKFDTGMGRIGFVCSEDNFDLAIGEAKQVAALPNIRVTGAFTHFASADEPDEDGVAYTKLQFSRFCRACDALKAQGVDVGIRHCCNSAAILCFPEMHLVASTAIGYADGYHRVLTNKARMIVRGKYAPVVGSVCMDQTMLDVTEIPDAREGDVVTVFGRDGDAFVSVDEVAALAGTINYEIVCAVSRRVPRCYYHHGENVHNFDYARWKEK